MMAAVWFAALGAMSGRASKPLARQCAHPTRLSRAASVVGSIRCATAASFEREAERVQFVGSFNQWDGMPKTRVPEIALFGRSNVGKSSALNCLSGRKRTKVARVSKTPGCTTALNLYRVGSVCTICDLPGYGFAKRGQEMQEQWGRAISDYVAEREQLRVMVVFIDPRHGPKENDANFFAWLHGFKIKDAALITVATKVDTLKPNEVNDRLLELQDAYRIPGMPIPFSSVKGTGRTQLWRAIEQSAKW
jgi:GTP-binding protein